jgi:hypothetical protein
VGTSLWHVTFESVFGVFESADLEVAAGAAVEVAVPEAAAAVVVAALAAAMGTWVAVTPAAGVLITGAATAVGDFVGDACSLGADAQPPTATVASSITVRPNVRMSGIGCEFFAPTRHSIIALGARHWPHAGLGRV